MVATGIAATTVGATLAASSTPLVTTSFAVIAAPSVIATRVPATVCTTINSTTTLTSTSFTISTTALVPTLATSRPLGTATSAFARHATSQDLLDRGPVRFNRRRLRVRR